jgi:uncharacterized protein (DUF433 family)
MTIDIGDLDGCVESVAGKCGGKPVLKGTRFTVAQVFAEVADGRDVRDLARDFDLDYDILTELFRKLAMSFDNKGEST